MSALLPERVNPATLARQQACLQGRVRLSHLPRLQEVVSEPPEDAQVMLTFRFDERHRVCVETQMCAELMLFCERCGEPFSHIINVAPTYAMVLSDEQSRQLPEAYEPWLLVDDTLPIAELVEEELLLSLPMIAKHDLVDCAVQLPDPV